MPHLLSFRRGWENENLARFLLHKMAFIAHPATTAEDIGSDFFCTLFEARTLAGHASIFPRNSFAIQIKSNSKPIDVSDKLQYLENLELPFFVGVADRVRLKLTIYSGEYIPAFFSYKGVPDKLEIELCEMSAIQSLDDFFEECQGKFILRFPRVVDIEATSDEQQLRDIARKLVESCSLTYDNIASKRNGQYTFKSRMHGTDWPVPMAFAGPVSATQYRDNLVFRVAEAFMNMWWTWSNQKDCFVESEFRAYERLLSELEGVKEYNRPVLVYARGQYSQLKELVDPS